MRTIAEEVRFPVDAGTVHGVPIPSDVPSVEIDRLMPPGVPIVVLSPHLDDAVLSCGAVLAERPHSFVVTVTAGLPAATARSPRHDLRGGWKNGRETVLGRRLEDVRATAVLQSTPVWLPFLDMPYRAGRTINPSAVVRILLPVLNKIRPHAVLFPLWTAHPDHRVTHDAAMQAMQSLSQVRWVAYAEAGYRQRHVSAVGCRLDELRARCSLRWATSGVAPDSPKRNAICEYASQIGALPRAFVVDALHPEVYFELQPKGS